MRAERLGNQPSSPRGEKTIGPAAAEGSDVQRPGVNAEGTWYREQGCSGPRGLLATLALQIAPTGVESIPESARVRLGQPENHLRPWRSPCRARQHLPALAIPKEDEMYLFGENKSARKYTCKREKNLPASQASKVSIHVPVRQAGAGELEA